MKRWIAVASVSSLLTVGVVAFLAVGSSRVECGQEVMVSKVDIPPNVELNPYINAGDFTRSVLGRGS